MLEAVGRGESEGRGGYELGWGDERVAEGHGLGTRGSRTRERLIF